jgi:hypothetical protein
MHREILNHIEDVLADSPANPALEHTGGQHPAAKHLRECPECRAEIRGMQQHACLLRELRAPAAAELEPRPGFYARVLERIEAEGPVSIWNLFIESAFGRRIAMASIALALLLGIYMITSERAADDALVAVEQTQMPVAGPLVVTGEDAPGRVITQMDQSISHEGDQPGAGQSSADAVLADLVTYQEQ